MKLEDILFKTQKQLKRALKLELQSLGYTPISKQGFLYAEGELPVLLVAHLDTVHKQPVRTICYSPEGDILMSPQGIGGDDRAGVYMILRLLQTYKCHVLFCEDEEWGGIGADCFTRSGIIPNVNYMVELDRCGANDAVFYDCGNTEFTDFILQFGFHFAVGSFSDISILGPAFDIAAVNISSGYYNAHTLHEVIDLRVVKHNIGRLKKLLPTNTPKFKYDERKTINDKWPLF